MILPKLAIKGSTTETQILFSLTQEDKMPYFCQVSVDSIDTTTTYYNNTAVTVHATKDIKRLLGTDNILTEESLSEYYKSALPRAAFTFLTYKDIFKKDWTSLSVYKSLPLINVRTHKYELLKVLQSFRTLYSEAIEEVSIVAANCLHSSSYIITGKIGELNLSIHLSPDARSDEVWKFSSDDHAIEVHPEIYEYTEIKIFSDIANPYYSFHKATHGLSASLVWSEIQTANNSLENLREEDWEILNHV